MISDSRILGVVGELSDPVCTASDVANRLPIGQRAVQKRLVDLADSGEVASREVGAKAKIWWVPGSVERTSHERNSSDERTAEPTDGEDIRSSEVRSNEHLRSSEGRTSEDVRSNEGDEISEALEGWRPGKVGSEDRKERVQAGRAAVEYIREHGENVSAQDIKDDVYPDHRIGDEKSDSWYDRVAKPALNRAKDAGLIELIPGYWEYEWVGPD